MDKSAILDLYEVITKKFHKEMYLDPKTLGKTKYKNFQKPSTMIGIRFFYEKKIVIHTSKFKERICSILSRCLKSNISISM